VAKAEPEPNAERPLVLAHELAGRVVDGRNVIGVEGVPHTEGVCRDAQSHTHELSTDGEAARGHEADQHSPADDVQQQDEASHSPQASSFVARECGAVEGGHVPTVDIEQPLLQVIRNKGGLVATPHDVDSLMRVRGECVHLPFTSM